MSEQVKNSFPDELAKLLDFSEEGEYIVAKLKHYLPTETFSHVATVARELGGEYISAGKESRFRFKKARGENERLKATVREFIGEVEAGLARLREAVKA